MPHLLSEKVQYLRHQRELLQADLARQLGLSRAHINNIEAHRRPASLEFIVRVAQLFGVTTDYLVRDTLPVAAVNVLPTQSSIEQYEAPKLFGPKLYTLRMKHQMTQAQLAQQIGLRTHAHISLLESGRKDPSVELVLKIADVFDVTTDYLLQDTFPIEAQEQEE